jgi:hypothetical protein
LGTKPAFSQQRDRPESGGADRDEQLEKSGILEQDKQRLAESRATDRAPTGADATRTHSENAKSDHHGNG